MATQTPTTPHAKTDGVVSHRLSVAQYLKMIETGILPERPRVELVRGRLITRMTKNTPHNFAVLALGEILRVRVAPGHIVSQESSLVLGDHSRPEPDFTVPRGPSTTYRSRDPRASDVVLIIEVSDSTYAKDRGLMWRLYAEARLPIYWIVNIGLRQVEVYSEPSGKGRGAAYAKVEIYEADSEVPVVIEGVEVGKVSVGQILP